MHKHIIWVVAAALSVVGCVENKEEIVIHSDGSLEAQMSAKGSAEDLVDGYPLPLDGPWRALDDTTLAWIAKVGPDTGSAQSRARIAAGAWPVTDSDHKETQLRVGAHFASPADMPRFTAPQREPYRSAYLERETKLAIEHKGARNVYTFERRLAARRWSDLEVFGTLEKQLPEETRTRLSHNEALSDAEWVVVTRVVREQYRRSAANFTRGALSAAYTSGDASLPTTVVSSALRAVDREITELISEQRLRTIYDTLHEPHDDKAGELDPALNPDALTRDALRRSLSNALTAANVSAAIRNTVFARLEWDFTAFDQSGDLGDENFTLSVTVPGAAVGGNFDSSEETVVDGVACSKVEWSFKGEALRDRDRVLRVVSVTD